MNDLYDKPNIVFKLVKFLKKEGQDVISGQCLREINGKIVFGVKDQKRAWKKHMEKTMSKENVWDQKTKIGVVEGSMEEVSLEEITSAIKKMKLGKVSVLTKVIMEIINASGKVGIDVMMKLCQIT